MLNLFAAHPALCLFRMTTWVVGDIAVTRALGGAPDDVGAPVADESYYGKEAKPAKPPHRQVSARALLRHFKIHGATLPVTPGPVVHNTVRTYRR